MEKLYDELLQTTFSANHIIITVNKRLAQYLQHNFATLQSANTKVWHSTNIITFTQFIDLIWQNWQANVATKDSYFIIDNFTSELIWQNILQQENNQNDWHDLFNNTWQLARKWLLTTNELYNLGNEKLSFWLKCSQHYQRKLQHNYWLDELGKIEKLISLDKNLTKFCNFKSITLVGFDNIEPLCKKLLGKLQENNIHIRYWSHNNQQPQNKKIKRYEFINLEQELRSIHSWLKQQIKKQNKNIGIIIPNLAQIRPLLQHEFNDLIQDGYINISGGEPLSEVNIISHALLLIIWCSEQNISENQIATLLNSNYWYQSANEKFITTNISYTLNLKRQKQPTYQEFIKEIIIYDELNLLQQRLQQANKILATKDKNYSSEWSKIISHALTIMGWPGYKNIDSYEYQAIQKWQSVLQHFAHYDYTIGKISLTYFIKLIYRYLQQTFFQIETANNNLHGQILGMLEGSVLNYDTLWLANMTDELWPNIPEPNPLLPLNLQKKYNLPHSSIDRELNYTKLLSQRCLQSSNNIIISHGAYENDKKLNISPLLRNIKLYKFQYKINTNFAEKIIAQDKKITIINDNYGHKLTSYYHKGGSSLLEDMAICPFKAFAKFRLKLLNHNIDKLPSAADKGTIIHAVLEKLFQQITSSHELKKLSENELQQIITKKCDQTIDEIKKNDLYIYNKITLDIEKEKIIAIILKWCQFEQQRCDDFTIHALEKKVIIYLDNFILHSRIDRIDQLSNGKYLLLDYKTGSQKRSLNPWLQENFYNTQLPLYAVSFSWQQLQGIAYAELNDHNKFNGICNNKESNLVDDGCVSLQKINLSNIQILHNNWRKKLQKLADQYLQGYAEVKPLQENVCRNCHLHALCRINDDN